MIWFWSGRFYRFYLTLCADLRFREAKGVDHSRSQLQESRKSLKFGEQEAKARVLPTWERNLTRSSWLRLFERSSVSLAFARLHSKRALPRAIRSLKQSQCGSNRIQRLLGVEFRLIHLGMGENLTFPQWEAGSQDGTVDIFSAFALF